MGLSPKEKKALAKTQFHKQRATKAKGDPKSFSITGQHIDADKEEVKATFEQVQTKGSKDMQNSPLKR